MYNSLVAEFFLSPPWSQEYHVVLLKTYKWAEFAKCKTKKLFKLQLQIYVSLKVKHELSSGSQSVYLLFGVRKLASVAVYK